VDSVVCHDELAIVVPLDVLLAFPPPCMIPSIIHGLSLSLALVFVEVCSDGLLTGGVARCKVEWLPRRLGFVVSELMDEGVVHHAEDECSDHVPHP